VRPLRDLISALPSWLADKSGLPGLPSNGYRVVFTLSRFVDVGISALMQASIAAVGRGTPTALKYVGDARGVIRGRLDTDADYRKKLPTWIQRWKDAGNARRLAREVWEYLGDSRVRVVTRAGHWITIETDGTMTETDAPWDWDSVSNPERNNPAAPWWSDEWIIVYPSWALRPGTFHDLTGDDGFGLGHLAPRAQVDALKLIVDRYKAAHSCVRAIIWTLDATRFDPAVPASKPDGTWGQWSRTIGGHCVFSGRDLSTCRFWEPR
jgi:hypothetical protein